MTKMGYASLQTGYLSDLAESTYVPIYKVAEQLRKAVLLNNIGRLERLYASLRYPPERLIECLNLACPTTRKSAVILAAERSLIEAVSWLISRGVEDEGISMSIEGDTILHIAAGNDCTELVTIYSSRFLEFHDEENDEIKLEDWTNNKGVTPLGVACQKGSLDSAILLLELGASLEAVDNEGNTHLHHAAAHGHSALVQLLINRGANAFIKNNQGFTPSDYAYSFQIEQEISNTVRAVLESNKKARKPRAIQSYFPPCSDDEEEGDSVEQGSGQPKVPSKLHIGSHPHLRSPGQFTPQLPLFGIPPATPTSAIPPSLRSAGTPASSTTSLPQPSPSLDAETSKALQRIFTRDQHAQAEFQASHALKAFHTSTSASIFGSPVLRSRSFTRERSSSTELSFASTSASPSTFDSPATSIGVAFSSRSSIGPPPASPLPALPTGLSSPIGIPKSSSSYFSKLRRSGSAGTRDLPQPEKDLARTVKPRLKHHVSLADLKKQASPVQSPASLGPAVVLTKKPFPSNMRARAGT